VRTSRANRRGKPASNISFKKQTRPEVQTGQIHHPARRRPSGEGGEKREAGRGGAKKAEKRGRVLHRVHQAQNQLTGGRLRLTQVGPTGPWAALRLAGAGAEAAAGAVAGVGTGCRRRR
jgi:hypothetical protein